MPSIAYTELHDTALVALSASTCAAASPVRCHRTSDGQYLQMQHAYGRSGGLLSGTEAAHRLRSHCDQPLSTLARWIVTRKIVSFEWHSHILVPVFQFDPTDMALRPIVVDVLREFHGVLDDWDCACWFAEPNTWLGDTAPVDAVTSQPQNVLCAARADRFVARG